MRTCRAPHIQKLHHVQAPVIMGSNSFYSPFIRTTESDFMFDVLAIFMLIFLFNHQYKSNAPLPQLLSMFVIFSPAETLSLAQQHCGLLL